MGPAVCEKYDTAAGAEKAKAVEKTARETAEIKVATDTDQSAAMATNVAAKELVKAIAKAVKTAHFAADAELQVEASSRPTVEGGATGLRRVKVEAAENAPKSRRLRSRQTSRRRISRPK